MLLKTGACPPDMMKGQLKLAVCCLVSFLITCCCACDDSFLMKVSELVEKEQVSQSLPFRGPGQWEQLEGVYYSDIMFNFHGDYLQTAGRHDLKIPDVDAFISPFAEAQLLDAVWFGKAPQPSKIQIGRTVQMLSQFHDHNRPNTSIITFFKQSYSEELDCWYTNPENVVYGFTNFNNTVPFQEITLGPAPLSSGIREMYNPVKIGQGMRIAADFDQTSVHMGYGALLRRHRDTYPEAWQHWADDNTNILSVIEAEKKYAYRPFSSDENTNMIDPRSYYIMHEFLDQAKREGRDVALVTTWVQSLDELRTEIYKGTTTPYCINNVDIAVQANVLSGLYLALSNGVVGPEVITNDPDYKLIIESTVSMMVFVLERNLMDRPDLALVYYPSVMQFYWFVGRTLLYMETDRQKGPLAVPVFESYYQGLKAVMTTKVTRNILDARTVDSSGEIYYDDFIGVADIGLDNTPINRAEDRVFTTAMAVNALVNIWSYRDDVEQKLVWRDDVPDDVMDTVKRCSKWLKKNALSGEFMLTNSFFSMDYKNRESVIFFYPGNHFEYLNGTKIDSLTDLPDQPSVYAMKGYVEPEEYERLLKMDKFGQATPLTFEGFNEGQGKTCLWSSKAFTYSSVMLAVSMSNALED